MASKKILCPYCFEEFDNIDAMYQCDSEERNIDGSYRCDRVTAPEYDQYWGANNLMIRYVWPQKSGFFSRLKGPTLKSQKCPQCGYMSRRFVCPHCYNWIPEDMVKNGAEIISVIGSPSSGKTHYIVALIHQLMNCGFRLDLEVHPTQIYRDGHKEESTQNRYIDLDRRLFRNKEVLNKTREDQIDIPWIFHLVQQRTDKHIYLVFYDTAGEKFGDQNEIRKNAKYLKESSAVIVVLDTLAIKHVSDVLKEEGIEGGGRTEDGLSAIITSMNELGDDLSKDKPVAFVLSKFDTVLDLSSKLGINTDEFKRGNTRINSSYVNSGIVDMEKINEISGAIEDVLSGEWNCDESLGGSIVEFARRWGSKKNEKRSFAKFDKNDPENNYKFFGVSALGGMPETLADKKVEPYRVMDPLVWVLKKLGQFDIPSK